MGDKGFYQNRETGYDFTISLSPSLVVKLFKPTFLKKWGREIQINI